jgi:gas vesicle protein
VADKTDITDITPLTFQRISMNKEELQQERGQLLEEIADCADQIATIDKQLTQEARV